MNKLHKTIFSLMLSTLLSCSLVACGMIAPDTTNPTTSSTKTVTNSAVTGAGVAQTDVVQGETPKVPVSYSIYEPFGLQFDPDKNELTFENELVRYFYDGVTLTDGGESVHCDYFNEKGTVDIHTVWEIIDNKDGSTNPFGELTGIERYSPEELEKRDLSSSHGSPEATTYVWGYYESAAKTFIERFKAYKDFGIEYVEAKFASGAGNVYYNGQLVGAFIDANPNEGVFSFHSADSGEIIVQTNYDKNGKLIGVGKIN